MKYVRNYLDKIEILKEKGRYNIGKISFETPVRHIHHSVEVYGFNIFGKNNSISIISDTIYFNGIESYYNGDLLIINVVFYENKKDIQHFDIKDVEKIISEKKPKLTILTHFGMTMIKLKPWEIAKKLSKKLGVKVIAASDGLEVDLDLYTK